MKSYWKEDYSWTEAAGALSNEAEDALRPVIESHLLQGYSIREISHIIMSTVGMMESRMAMDFRMGTRKP